jgi:D-alanine-D-alanine ligase
MKIGLTYDLRKVFLAMGYSEEETAELDREDTVEAIEQAASHLGHQVERIGHGQQLVERLAAGDRWDLVFNICEGLHGIAREAQVPAVLDLYKIAYTFSDPLVMAVSLHKGMTKAILGSHGIATSPYTEVHSPSDCDRVDLSYPLFVKPIAEGTGKGVTPQSKVLNRQELKTRCEELLARYRQPVLVEPFLPGREFTVGLVGTGDSAKALGTLEIILKNEAEPEVYSYLNKEKCEELVEYPLVLPTDPVVAKAEAIALAAWRALGCRDAGRVDLRCDAAGNPLVMELNPLAGLHPSHSDLPMLGTALGLAYHELIDMIIRSAATRVSRS